MAKPRVFVGSSTERLEIARAIQAELVSSADVDVWDQGNIAISSYTLDGLLAILEENDFGVFVFAPDDGFIRQHRDKPAGEKLLFTVRDNVLFEAGIFAGKLGRDRTFFVSPGFPENQTRIASDLKGVTFGYYAESDERHRNAVAPVCGQIRRRIEKLGRKPVVLRSQYVQGLPHVNRKLAEQMHARPLGDPIRSSCRELLNFFQRCLDAQWPDHRVVSSLMVLNLTANLSRTGEPTQFRCVFADYVTQHPIVGNGSDPEPAIPIKGSLAGRAFTQKRPYFASDIRKCERLFSKKIFAQIKDRIGSAVVWPIISEGDTMGILKVDSPTRHMICEANDTLVALMSAVVSQFELAIRYFDELATDLSEGAGGLVRVAADDS